MMMVRMVACLCVVGGEVAAKFDEAMNWLNEWREGIEGDVPF